MSDAAKAKSTTPDKPLFTPGPWCIYDGQGAMERIIVTMEGASVADANAGFPCDEAEQNANARLIAAAPNLYAALVKTMKKCRCRGTGVWTRSCTLCGDSTFDHECNDKCLPCDDADCVAARAVIAEVGGVA